MKMPSASSAEEKLLTRKRGVIVLEEAIAFTKAQLLVTLNQEAAGVELKSTIVTYTEAAYDVKLKAW